MRQTAVMSAPLSPDKTAIAASDALAQFAGDVRYYMMLEPRQLPSRYLYDPLGSALFDAICWLPWYGITRAEDRLLRDHAHEVFRRVPSVSTIVELGPGSGQKLRTLIDCGRPGPGHLDVHLVDVSHDALVRSALTLASIGGVRIVTHEQPYEAGLAAVAQQPADIGRTLVLFLGSNIGNFDPPAAHAFLRAIRAALAPGDALLLGVDLVKPERQLLLAYDDPLGVTAAFNRNLLVRINRELDGNFEISHYQHRAVWNEAACRVEIYLVADSPQHVTIPKAQIDFEMAAGEQIWTESSYKYQPQAFVHMFNAASFRVNAWWVDEADRFALFLLDAI
jgi:L-histidine N-alpha-methyltransferase